MSYDVTLRVWRGDASGGDFRDYVVPVEEGEVVLDAVHRLQASQAGDLAVRWNCKAGKCGSCSAEINGMPKLMCMTRLNSLDTSAAVTINPVRTFPIVKDLVTDVSFNYEVARRVPAFTPAHDNKGGSFRMQQVDVERGQEFRKCIECFLCQNVCHVIRDHEENKATFAGPRFFIRYAELDMHPLDTLDRRPMAQELMGLSYCNITKCCTEVCPEGIKITDNGIIPMKERVVDRKYDPVVWLGTKIGIRADIPERERAEPAAGAGPSPIKRPGDPVELRHSAAGVRGQAAVLDRRGRGRHRGKAAPDALDVSPGGGGGVVMRASESVKRYVVPGAVATAGIALLAWALHRAHGHG